MGTWYSHVLMSVLCALLPPVLQPTRPGRRVAPKTVLSPNGAEEQIPVRVWTDVLTGVVRTLFAAHECWTMRDTAGLDRLVPPSDACPEITMEYFEPEWRGTRGGILDAPASRCQPRPSNHLPSPRDTHPPILHNLVILASLGPLTNRPTSCILVGACGGVCF